MSARWSRWALITGLAVSCAGFAGETVTVTASGKSAAARIQHSGDLPLMRRTHSLMGTRFEFIIAGDKQAGTKELIAEKAIADAVVEMRRIENLMSEWRPETPLSAINQAAGKHPVKVPAELMRTLEASLELGRLTEGKFDITWGPLGKVWDFRNSVRPAASQLAAALNLVDFQQLVLDAENQTAFLQKSDASIGLGGIAKGYAVDRAVQIIRDAGFEEFVVNGGGDLYASGKRDGKLWQVGIQDPRNDNALLALLPVANAAIATSGDYQRYFIQDGRRYHHILDPATGQPARGCQSVTVLAPRAYQADALATGIFVLGPERGLMLANRLDGVEAMIVDAEGNTHVSAGLLRPAKK